jgi:Domain of unknown function (DUF3883)
MTDLRRAQAGREAAGRLWRDGLKAAIEDPLHADFASAAVAEFARLQSERTPGIYRDALAGAEMSAEQLNVEPLHGVVEVVQNADDVGASELRMAVRTGPGRRDLLFVHDGEPVRLPDLVAMALAFVSTKREDASTKGRFGIGLTTLRALGDTLAVHSGPYHASITGNQVAATSAARSIDGFFDPKAGETLLELRLRPGFDTKELRAWLTGWDASSLLFLDTLRAVRLHSLRSRKPLVEVKLEERRLTPRRLNLGRHMLECEETTLVDPRSGRSWRRYVVERPVPANAPKRRHKATGTTTPLAVAVPDQAGDPRGRLFAGLPLGDARLGVPFSLSAQFNVDTARTAVQHDDWNGWLLERLVELIVAVARERFARDPATGWAVVPLVAEAEEVSDRWLRERLIEAAQAVQRRVARGLTLEIEGVQQRARDLVYEARPFERILDAGDLARLHPDLVPLARALRDRDGRWRAVLAEFDLGREVTAEDALRLLDLDDTELGPRRVSWFIRFARAVIAAEEGDGLWWRRSIVLADGTRIIPPAPHVEAEVLVRRARRGSLAARLGLARVIHPAYLSENPEAAAVRRWLERSEILAGDVGVEPTLRALAQRGSSGEAPPLELSDEDLLVLRNALVTLERDEQVERDEQEELGRDIGRAISVRGFRWERGKRTRMAVTPAQAYLPARLEDRRDGWAKAAGATQGLHWIETRYGRLLKRPARGDRRTPGALGFFRLLGAEVAPRVVEPERFDTRYGDPASPIDFARLTDSQREALAGQYATHLKTELLSPDLHRVVVDISRERSRHRRRERARALLRTLDRDWRRLYEGHETATAVYSSNSWWPATTLPASWLAAAMDTPWLTTEAGIAAPPRELVVRTPSTEALYGRDAPVFTSEVAQEMASSPAVRALGLTTDPRVSEIVDQLGELQARGEAVDPADVALRYAALAAAVANVDAPPESMVGDLTLRQLRARFGANRRTAGLIFVDGEWLPPAKAMRGKPIFGRRRIFVPDRSHSERLWRVLGIPTPTVSDCVRVLTEIARAAPTAEDEQILLDTYVYLAERARDLTRSERRAIAGLPLWSGQRWLRQRPVYAMDDAELVRALAARLPVWQPPLSPRSLGGLVEALGVTLLGDRDFAPNIADAERAAGEGVRETFAAAVAHLRDWLARHDPGLYDTLEPSWEELADAEIAVAPNLQLELRLSGRRPVRVQARAHVARSPLLLSFADVEDVGAPEAGGRAIAALFSQGDRDKAALAWSSAWMRARIGDRSARMRLAEEQKDDDPLEALFEQASQTRKHPLRPRSPKRAVTKAAQATDGQTSTTAAIDAVRRLKSQDDLIVSSVSRPESEDGANRRRGSRGPRTDKPAGKPIDVNARPAPRSAPRAYSPQEQEHLALVALHRAVNGELSDLKDFRHLQGVGADALDRLERAFEIKSFATAMPDQVTLTANEFERALKDGSKYHLAVVAGLEEGYETVVRIIADPVHTLEVQKSTTLVLGGVRSAKKPIEVRFETSATGA